MLSRKPTAQTPDAATGIGQLSLDEDDDDDDDPKKDKPLTAEERQLKAQKDREEKQRKYDETRRRLGLGASSTPQTPGNASPSKQPRSNQGSRHQSKTRNGDLRPSSAAAAKPRQLYDPNYQVKPDSIFIQRPTSLDGVQSALPLEQQPIRSPRGPDPTGKGFARVDRAT